MKQCNRYNINLLYFQLFFTVRLSTTTTSEHSTKLICNNFRICIHFSFRDWRVNQPICWRIRKRFYKKIYTPFKMKFVYATRVQQCDEIFLCGSQRPGSVGTARVEPQIFKDPLPLFILYRDMDVFSGYIIFCKQKISYVIHCRITQKLFSAL